jgi:hypothetical protein
MGWTETDAHTGVREWVRDDDRATIRMRETTGGRWVVRLDRLHQAPEGSLYRRAEFETRDDARRRVRDWSDRYDSEA